MTEPAPHYGTAGARALLHRVKAIPTDLRRITYELRTEGSGRGREASAIGVGVFIGCLPLYGFHLALCALAGSLLGLNRLKVYLAANISNPFVAPWLLLLEIQAGAWLRRGSLHPLTVEAVRTTALPVFGTDLLLGSVVVGAVLALIAGSATYATMRSGRDADFEGIVRRAADRYAGASITAWEFARGKLRYDPIYRGTIGGGWFASGGTLVDIGCGQGLTLAILAEARRLARSGAWPSAWEPLPEFDRLVGVETRARAASLARDALAGDAEIVTADARTFDTMRAHAVLLFDVLHMMGADEQDALIARLARALEPGGVIVVREADASAGWRFTAVRLGNRMKAAVSGRVRQQFCFRSAAGWQACFDRHGLQADVRPMGQGTPFANVLLLVTQAETPPASAPRGALELEGGRHARHM